MTLTLEIAPEIEAALEEAAAIEGSSAVDYAAHILYTHLSPFAALMQSTGRLNREVAAPTGDGKTAAARLALVRSIGAYDTRAAAELLPLSDEDISRESIYGERGQ